MNKLHALIQQAVRSRYALPFFISAVFIEPFFFMPTIPLYIIYGIEMPRKALYYALIGAVVSVLGAATAYWFAYWLADICGMDILNYLISAEKIHTIQRYCKHWMLWPVIALFSFMPVPFKVITIPSGFLHISFIPFIASVALGRFSRYVLLGIGLSIWGQRLQQIIDRYFYHCIVLIIGIILLTWWLFH
jgi:membrane protein YqaA with SNARE-associated domain